MYYLDDGLVVHDKGGAWAVFHLHTTRSELLSEDQLKQQVQREADRLVALTGFDCQLLGMPQRYDVDSWLQRLIDVTPKPNSGFEELLEMQRERALTAGSSRRVVYLAVKLDETKRSGWSEWLGVSSLFQQTDKLLGTENPRPSDEMLRHLHQRMDIVRRKVAIGSLQADVATAAELRWLLMRSMWRGLAELPEPERRETWGGEARALLEGHVIENCHRWLRIEQPGFGEFYQATVGLARFPDELRFPGGEWLAAYEELPFSCEYSVRFRVMSHREASKAVGKAVKSVLDQIAHIQETRDKEGNPRQVPRDLEEKGEVAQELAHQVKNLREPLVDAWGRLVVTAPTEQEMEERLEQLIEHYHDYLEIDGVAPTGHQWGLFQESMLGFPFKLQDVYRQRMKVYALAGSGATTSTNLGDTEGPYIGVTSIGGDHVNIDPFRASRTDGAPLIGIFGRTGAGKSNLAYLLAYLARPRGATVVVMDPKEEANGLASLCEEFGNVYPIRLEEGSAGRLDPFAIITDKAVAAELAATMLTAMLPPVTADDVADAIISAASTVANKPGPVSLVDVVDQIEKLSTWGRLPQAVGTLRAAEQSPLGRVCFARGEVRGHNAFNALTLLQFRNLPLPEGSIDPLRYTQPNRMATAIIHAMSALVYQLSVVGTPEDPKLLIYDEARAILQNPEGRANLERQTLQGRSLGIVPVLMSQNPSHMVSGTDDLSNQTLPSNMGTAFVFELPSALEAEYACRLLGIEATEENVYLIQNLAPKAGESGRPEYAVCIMRDANGRVGMIQPDLQTDKIKRAFDTTPGSRFGLRGFEGLEEDAEPEPELVGAGNGETREFKLVRRPNPPYIPNPDFDPRRPS